MEMLICGMAISIILFQIGVIAPTVLKTLDFESTSKFLRAIWPKFFRFLIALGIVFFLISWKFTKYLNISIDLVMASCTWILPLIALLIIPMTNRAADQGNKIKFKYLHLASVLLTVITLLVYIFIVIRSVLIYF